MIKKVLRRVACACALASLMVVTTPNGARPAAVAPAAPAVEQVVGSGSWATMLACAGCVVGAGYLLTSGTGAILVAVNMEGSAGIAASCVLACYAAVN
jgi:hypothetical protein